MTEQEILDMCAKYTTVDNAIRLFNSGLLDTMSTALLKTCRYIRFQDGHYRATHEGVLAGLKFNIQIQKIGI